MNFKCHQKIFPSKIIWDSVPYLSGPTKWSSRFSIPFLERSKNSVDAASKSLKKFNLKVFWSMYFVKYFTKFCRLMEYKDFADFLGDISIDFVSSFSFYFCKLTKISCDYLAICQFCVVLKKSFLPSVTYLNIYNSTSPYLLKLKKPSKLLRNRFRAMGLTSLCYLTISFAPLFIF